MSPPRTARLFRRRSQLTALGTRQFSDDWIKRHLGGAERRRVTILVCGCEATSADFDTGAEDFVPVLAWSRQQVRRIIEEHGGRIGGPKGAATMAVWGYPASEEDHTRLAVLAGLRLTSLCTPYIAVSCGVETGLVVVRTPEPAEELELLGPAIRRAEKLRALAPPGQLVVGDMLGRLIAWGFDIERTNAGDCWRVLAARPGGRRAGVTAPMVGHAQERSRIDRLCERLASGKPQCLSITGEAGIGKSTLLRYLRGKLAVQRGTWIEIGFLPEFRRAPLHALRTAMCQMLSEPSCGLAQFLAQSERDDRQLVEIFLRLRDVASVPQPRSEGFRQDRLFALILDWIRAQARHAPLALVFEDVHWADPAAIDLIARAGERLHELGRVLLVWTSRTSDPRAIRTGAERTRLTLARLSAREIDELLAGSPSQRALTRSIRKQIAARSEGIPLFAEELARLCSTAPVTQNAVEMLLEPGSLNSVLYARLDSLGETKALAQAAAVIGRDFDASTLALLLQMDEARLAEALQHLVAGGILNRAPRRGSWETFSFSHALIREAAYASVLKSRRRQLHGRVAEIMAHDADEAARQWPEIVAGHFAAAGDGRSALHWWHEAAKRAAEISATRAAVEHLRRALAAIRQHPGACTAGQEVEIRRLLGVQMAALSGNAAPQVIQILERCLELSRRNSGGDGDFDTLWTLHSCYLVRGDIKRALAIGARLISSVETDAREERRLRAHRMQGLAELLGGHLEEAFAHYGLVLDLYDERRHAVLRFQHASDQGALAHAQLAWGETIAGRTESSDRNAAAALALAGRLQHPHTSAHVMCVLAARAQTLADARLASVLAFAGKTLGERHEFPYWSAWADFILGWTEGCRQPDGIGLIQRAIHAYRRTGASQALPYALLLLSETALAADRPEQALAAAEEGSRVAERHGLALFASELLRVRAMAHMRMGSRLSSASALLERAVALAARQGAHIFRSRAESARPMASRNGFHQDPDITV